jgi:hypothetical protein
MFTENKNEFAILDGEPLINPEKIWGGDELEWKDWKNAERNMSLEQYNNEQVREMTGDHTKAAFEKVYGTSIKEINPELLARFFMDHGGSIYFKRRFYCRRNEDGGVTLEMIKNYYENKLWEKETSEHA